MGFILVKTLGTQQHEALIRLIIEQRQEIGMTQSELAAELGEYQSFVARMESGQRRVDVIEYLELARILKFDASKILKFIQSSS